MRPSPQRHTLAVLRTLIGLTQKEMATHIGCSTPTIQAVELGKLTLSDKLAERIVWETGVSLQWLLAGDPAAPMATQHGLPYTKRAYEIRRSELSRPKTELSDTLHAHFVLHSSLVKLTTLLLHSHSTGAFNLCAYKIGAALDALVTQFGAKLDWGDWLARRDALAAKYVEQEINAELGLKTAALPPLNLLAQLKETQALLDAFHRDFLAAFDAKRRKFPPRRTKPGRPGPLAPPPKRPTKGAHRKASGQAQS